MNEIKYLANKLVAMTESISLPTSDVNPVIDTKSLSLFITNNQKIILI